MSARHLQREVEWTPATGLGAERLRLRARRDIHAAGRVAGITDGREFRLSYTISCDAFWRVRRVRARLLSGARTELDLRSDSHGSWSDGSLNPLPQLDGCIDVDISVTPFTNTLPIRRLALRPGESAEVALVFIDVPAMTIQPVRQRYTCLERHATAGALYRFDSLPYDALPDGFTAILPVDADGIVLDYPGLFTRLRPH